MAEFVKYEVWLGTFEGEEFVWKTIKTFNDFEKAYDFYKTYTIKQMSYTNEELRKIWSSGRVDVELRQENKLLNWCGIYSRRVDKDSFDEEEKEVVKEADTKDSHPSYLFH